MGLSESFMNYIPSPDNGIRMKLQKMGISFYDDNEIKTEYSLPFGWNISCLIYEDIFLITDLKCVRVEINNGKYTIIKRENDNKIELQ